MHHVNFVFSIKSTEEKGMEVNHEFGSDLLALPNKKIVHFLRALRQFVYHSLLIPLNNKHNNLSPAENVEGFITIELTGELALSTQDYVLEASVDSVIQALPHHQQAQVFSALVMFIDQAGIMFVRQSSANNKAIAL